MEDLVALWSSRMWLDEALAWVDERLEVFGERRTGDPDARRVRFWSATFHCPTDRGDVWLKVNNPGQSFEGPLLSIVDEVVPGLVLPALAVDEKRRLILTRHVGEPYLDAIEETTWTDVLESYGRWQRALSEHRARVLAAGVTAMPAARAVEYVERAAVELAALPPTHPWWLSAERVTALLAGRDRLAAATDRLDAAPVGDSFEHNDLHGKNLLRAGERVWLIDLGDGVWAHPFASLDFPLGLMQRHWNTAPDDPRVRRCLDAYLDAWSDLAPLAQLRALVPDAIRVGGTQRFACMWRLLPHTSTEEPEWAPFFHAALSRTTAAG